MITRHTHKVVETISVECLQTKYKYKKIEFEAMKLSFILLITVMAKSLDDANEIKMPYIVSIIVSQPLKAAVDGEMTVPTWRANLVD